mmetsp:Transcript_5570/g.12689  ORF Transcript_5570/g.12689 Transcript_5570/m.12689 type:complete len:115 (-) Transcript_5570:21-365(-)
MNLSHSNRFFFSRHVIHSQIPSCIFFMKHIASNAQLAPLSIPFIFHRCSIYVQGHEDIVLLSLGHMVSSGVKVVYLLLPLGSSNGNKTRSLCIKVKMKVPFSNRNNESSIMTFV